MLLKEEGKDCKIQLYDFVEPELQYLRDNCNFSDQELEYFNLRAKRKSNVQISIAMNVSESQVSKLAKRVKNKIKRII